jgi:hypothetical protein
VCAVNTLKGAASRRRTAALSFLLRQLSAAGVLIADVHKYAPCSLSATTGIVVKLLRRR